MAAFYLNELLLKLTTRHDPMPELFEDYRRALGGLRGGAAVEAALRVFEKRLLEALGYGLDLSLGGAHGQGASRPTGTISFAASRRGWFRTDARCRRRARGALAARRWRGRSSGGAGASSRMPQRLLQAALARVSRGPASSRPDGGAGRGLARGSRT